MGCSSRRHDQLHPLAGLLVLVLVTARCVSAQSPSNDNSNNSNNNSNNPYLANAKFSPSMAIVIVVLISAFFFLGFFSIYIRQCSGNRRDSSVTARTAAATRSRRQRGLDPEILATFPTLVYSDVRAHKIGKGSLECAVCLSEFDDDETLRLLPRCDHVFHSDCIDAWLAAHVTCPVCRSNLDEPAGSTEISAEPPPEQAPVQVVGEENQVVIEMRSEDTEEERMRRAEMDNLERFVNMKRARSRARPANFPRSHSTGHSLVLPGENLDRFTLRLPENIRRDLVERAEMMQRTKSLVAFPTEGSSRRGFRRGGGGEGSIGKGRSIRLGRSDRWGSFLLRTLSTKMPNWGRRGDDVDGSTSIKGADGEGSSV